jgi:hypothetical protein
MVSLIWRDIQPSKDKKKDRVVNKTEISAGLRALEVWEVVLTQFMNHLRLLHLII